MGLGCQSQIVQVTAQSIFARIFDWSDTAGAVRHSWYLQILRVELRKLPLLPALSHDAHWLARGSALRRGRTLRRRSKPGNATKNVSTPSDQIRAGAHWFSKFPVIR